MKSITHQMITSIILGLSIFHVASLPASEKSETSKSAENESGGFLKLSLGYRLEEGPFHKRESGLSVFVNGRYQWENGLFVELPGGSHELNPGLNYGYNFFNTDHWSFDLLAHKSQGDIVFNATINEESIKLKKEGDVRAGFRATGNFDQDTVQLIVTPYSFSDDYDDGVYASLWFARGWQYKNWNFHASLGFQYRSEEILDYFYGVSEALAIPGVPVYQAGSGVNVNAQFGVSYPITKNWIFESYLRHTKVDDSILDSPIISNSIRFDDTRTEDVSEVGVLFSYVF
ncbi:MipA/OmpV family protein [Aliikangiella coralliicola]|uniref:MipA/OmpV family protein n=1 Tax=Aliikangiella coralliicola TaxID=2592383 RepID=A0A545UIU1_9GAMM|nr:MipA/OmpV family protein [Aliikangiella coralliicola]TQV89378.1 MipA/OmpV family protein [Aliikangiella coralliicola]